MNGFGAVARLTRATLLGATICAGFTGLAHADVDDGIMETPIQTPLPTGQFISPMAATGAVFTKLDPGLPDHPDYRASGAIKTAVNVNQSELLVMTSGYNNLNYTDGAKKGQFEPSASNEYIFVYDIAGANAQAPKVVQVIQIPDTYVGLTYSPDGLTFYASGGVDDLIHVYTKTPAAPGAGPKPRASRSAMRLRPETRSCAAASVCSSHPWSPAWLFRQAVTPWWPPTYSTTPSR